MTLEEARSIVLGMTIAQRHSLAKLAGISKSTLDKFAYKDIHAPRLHNWQTLEAALKGWKRIKVNGK
jgi:hypothetical protein